MKKVLSNGITTIIIVVGFCLGGQHELWPNPEGGPLLVFYLGCTTTFVGGI